MSNLQFFIVFTPLSVDMLWLIAFFNTVKGKFLDMLLKIDLHAVYFHFADLPIFKTHPEWSLNFSLFFRTFSQSLNLFLFRLLMVSPCSYPLTGIISISISYGSWVLKVSTINYTPPAYNWRLIFSPLKFVFLTIYFTRLMSSFVHSA